MFVIEVPYFNLDHIYNSGQAPRWIQLHQSPEKSKYVIPYGDKALKIEQQRDRFDWTKHRFIMSCSEEDFYSVWFKYFNLETDYLAENSKVKKLEDEFFTIIANRGHGIHVLNQDPFEAFIYSNIARMFGYEKAAKAINHIAEVCGTKHIQSMREAGKITWYEFPTPEMIVENIDKLKRMGGLNWWLEDTCWGIVSEELDMTGDLYQLFTAGSLSRFPEDWYVDDLIEDEFGCDHFDFEDWYINEIENKGLIYMYLLHHKLNPPKEGGPDEWV